MKCKLSVCRDWHFIPETVDATIHGIDKNGVIATIDGCEASNLFPLSDLVDLEKFINKNGDFFIPDVICPVCGSLNVIFESETREMSPYGAGEISLQLVNNKCSDCHAEGDFNGVNDVRIEAACKDIVKKRSCECVDNLNQQGISNEYIERCLGLRIGSIREWQYQGFPMEVYVLLRFLEIQPHLIEIAKAGYPKFWLEGERNHDV